MGRPDLPSVLVLAAMLAAPLRVASAAEPPAAAKTTEPAPTESAPPPAGEPTPEQRAKELGWDDEEPATQPATPPAEVKSEGDEDDEDDDDEEDDDEPDKPDVDDVIEADPVLAKDYRRARGMAIGGGSAAGVGLILVASGAYFVAAEALSSGSEGALSDRSRLVGGWVTMSIGLAALTTGVIVMALGLAKRKRVLTEAEARLPPTAMVSPWFDERGGGVGLSLRF
jgi:uncharacterized membrane protein